MIERAAILSPDGRILPEHFPAAISKTGRASLESVSKGKSTLDDVERAYIEQVLGQTNGNKAQAARILGIDVTTLWRKLKKT